MLLNIEPTAAMKKTRAVKTRGLKKANFAARFNLVRAGEKNLYSKRVKDVETFSRFYELRLRLGD